METEQNKLNIIGEQFIQNRNIYIKNFRNEIY
jgi:hypothetical protein